MKDTDLGTRDKRGFWKPKELINYGPLFSFPTHLLKILSWLFLYPGFIFPWGAFFIMLSAILWLYLTPSFETLKYFSFDWILFIFVRNLILISCLWGILHFRLYSKQKQRTEYKYNSQFQSKPNKTFLFKKQTYDNMFWSLCSGVPIWSTYEVFALWAYANGFFPTITWEGNPIYFILLTILLVNMWHEIHFYFTHKLIHWGPLYKFVHSLHHKNTNPGPWSGLAMHPIEHLIYFSGILIYFFIPVHPFHAIFHLTKVAIGPGLSHSGFHKLSVGNESTVNTKHYLHYLHHRYFECNYGAGLDGAILPLDKWLGTFHDGSNEAQERMVNKLRESD